MTNVPAYGLWSLVIINSLVFIVFAFRFAKPQSPRDWRSFGAFYIVHSARTAWPRPARTRFLAMESARVVLMKSDAFDLVGAIELSHATLRKTHRHPR